MVCRNIVLAVLVSALQTVYEAQVLTFGCNSSIEVAQLQRVRSNAEEFQELLYEKITYGQCVLIAKGAVVEGTVESTDHSVLRIAARTSPPGYMAPVGDFKLVPREKKP
jgi:hypothetical protein